MTLVRDGIPASPGIVIGPAYVLRWEVPRVPHVTVDDRILGGLVVRVGDTVMDGSVRRRLGALRSRMLSR